MFAAPSAAYAVPLAAFPGGVPPSTTPFGLPPAVGIPGGSPAGLPMAPPGSFAPVMRPPAGHPGGVADRVADMRAAPYASPGFGVSPLSPSFARPASGTATDGDLADAMHASGGTPDHARRLLDFTRAESQGSRRRYRSPSPRGRRRRATGADRSRPAEAAASPPGASPPPAGPSPHHLPAPVFGAAPPAAVHAPPGAPAPAEPPADYAAVMPWVHARSDQEALPAVWGLLCAPHWSGICRDIPQQEVWPALHRMSAGGLITYQALNCLSSESLDSKWLASPAYPDLTESRSRMLIGRLQALAKHLNQVLMQSHLPAGPASSAAMQAAPPLGVGDLASQVAAHLAPAPVPDGLTRDAAGRVVPMAQAPVFPIGSFLESYNPGERAWEEFDSSHFLLGTELLQRHRTALKFTDAGAVWLPPLPLFATFPVWTYEDRSAEATEQWQKAQCAERPSLARLISSTFAYYSQVVTLNLPSDHPGHLSMPDLFAHILLLNRLAQTEGTAYANYYAVQLAGHLVNELRKPPGARSSRQIILRDWLVFPSREVADKLKALKAENRLHTLATWQLGPKGQGRGGAAAAAVDADDDPVIVHDYTAPPAKRPAARAKPSSAPSRSNRGGLRLRPQGKGRGSAPPGKRPRVEQPPQSSGDVAPGSVCLFEHLGHNPPVRCPDPNCNFVHLDTRKPDQLALYAAAWQNPKKKRPQGVQPPPPPHVATPR